MNIGTILVPTDFSKDGDNALAKAVDLAKLLRAKLVVLHAYHVDLPIASPMVGAYTLPPRFYEQVRSEATARVEKTAHELAAQGIEASGIAVSEPASVAIVEQAERLPADLIVMGTRGLSGLKHVLLGSVAERVIREAPCPVLTVKAGS